MPLIVVASGKGGVTKTTRPMRLPPLFANLEENRCSSIWTPELPSPKMRA